MTAHVLHAHLNRMFKDRLEVTVQVERNGRPFQFDGYCWIDGKYGPREPLVGSMLQMAARTHEPLRIETKETAFGQEIVWAERLEQTEVV